MDCYLCSRPVLSTTNAPNKPPSGGFLICMKLLRTLDQVFFSKPSAKEIAVSEMEEHRRQLLKQIAAMHYHQRMVDYHYAVIAELEQQVK